MCVLIAVITTTVITIPTVFVTVHIPRLPFVRVAIVVVLICIVIYHLCVCNNGIIFSKIVFQIQPVCSFFFQGVFLWVTNPTPIVFVDSSTLVAHMPYHVDVTTTEQPVAFDIHSGAVVTCIVSSRSRVSMHHGLNGVKHHSIVNGPMYHGFFVTEDIVLDDVDQFRRQGHFVDC